MHVIHNSYMFKSERICFSE